MSYKQSPFPMASGTSGHASALKHSDDDAKFGKGHSEDVEGHPDLHNIGAEKLNTTEQTCAICGVAKSKHKGKGHAFKIQKPAGPDTKSPE